MSSFTNILIVSPLTDGNNWALRRELQYDVGYLGSDESIIVPEGFVTDFATIPRFLWFIYPRWGKYGNASVIHDYIYFKKMYSRKRCDEIFLEAMKVLKVSKFTRYAIYYSVRIFGFIYWGKEKKNKTHEFKNQYELV